MSNIEQTNVLIRELCPFESIVRIIHNGRSVKGNIGELRRVYKYDTYDNKYLFTTNLDGSPIDTSTNRYNDVVFLPIGLNQQSLGQSYEYRHYPTVELVSTPD